jgi:hypothetical protein
MERDAIVSETVVVHLQVLLEGVGQLWGENVIGVRIQTDDVKHNDMEMAIQTLEIASFMSCFTYRNLFTKFFAV